MYRLNIRVYIIFNKEYNLYEDLPVLGPDQSQTRRLGGGGDLILEGGSNDMKAAVKGWNKSVARISRGRISFQGAAPPAPPPGYGPHMYD